MKASTLIRKIEQAGGRFVVKGRSVGAVNVPAEYEAELAKKGYLVRAWILEREASHRWEASGWDPNWWRDGVGRAEPPGPEEVVIKPKDVFDALRQIIGEERVS